MINTQDLKKALELMQPRQVIYELVKQEMMKRGRWRNLKRGKPFIK